VGDIVFNSGNINASVLVILKLLAANYTFKTLMGTVGSTLSKLPAISIKFLIKRLLEAKKMYVGHLELYCLLIQQ